MKTRHVPMITKLWRTAILVLALLPWVGTAGADATLDEQLIKAAARGDAPLAKSLLDKGADVNAERVGGTVLMAAARAGNLELVEYFIDKGADVNATNVLGQTVLMIAAARDNLDMVKYLIDKGAHINAKDIRGDTALTYLTRYMDADSTEMVRYLRSHGAK
ncbi:MAG: ankyrin repeat domain-containing protein [Desulfomonile tiedjei]|nr:ankyrin repeat domain-containing protein [Desulfomonile tiedjei]